ncbi:uracil-DNA glycosylase family protein [Rheinheimera aquimaris]|uniref:Uracil-DNA glycosylase family protein n=1 Tax=Rheinheimera aquimaris TaxID=412437 RepID=A0ABP3NKE9_9GAMM|nr:uracil-DNA glycosylase family protein [Rheinheimera aquimaris]MCB5213172.1 uracil-DNA glycosylase family protein [Rheinheimera aquimaris]
MPPHNLADTVRDCSLCAAHLPQPPRPILQWHPAARILIAGQAPGQKAHDAAKPFADASGDRLRQWLGLTTEQFYNPKLIAILPMGFCFPGRGKSGDLPPRPECAPSWRPALLHGLKHLKLTLVIGQYAKDWHLPDAQDSLTDTVAGWQQYWPDIIPLPHPSPRNNIWLTRNPWFARQLLPALQQRVQQVLAGAD